MLGLKLSKHHVFHSILYMVLAVLVTLSIIGCSSDNSEQDKNLTIRGRVIDDAIYGAKVVKATRLMDSLNDDDEINEPVYTDSTGHYDTTMYSQPEAGDLYPQPNARDIYPKIEESSAIVFIATGGTDIGTGEPFTGMFTAPIDSTVISPLTTIVSSVMKEGNKTVTEAIEIINSSLNLDKSINLTTFDPIAVLEHSTEGSDKKVAQEVLIQQTEVQVVLHLISVAVASASDTVQELNVTTNTADKIAELILNSTPYTTEAIVDIAKETFKNLPKEKRDEAIAKVADASKVILLKIVEMIKMVDEKIKSVDADTAIGLDVIAVANRVLKVAKTVVGVAVKKVVTKEDLNALNDIDIKDEVLNVQLPYRPVVPKP